MTGFNFSRIYYGYARKLINAEEIQKKQLNTINEITREYKGETVGQVVNQIENAGYDVNQLFKQLLEYKLYGLIFTGLYGQIRNHLRKRKLLDIFGARDLILEEEFLRQEVRNEKNEECISFKIQGRIADYCKEDWLSEAKYLGVQITDEQQPELDFYGGEILINTATSVMEKAEINLSLSYGEQYKREQVFSMLLMSDEDIKDLY